MMDRDMMGVEPDFSLVKSKKLVGWWLSHDRQPLRADGDGELGHAPEEVEQIVAFVDERNTVIGAPFVKAEHYPASTARSASARSTTPAT